MWLHSFRKHLQRDSRNVLTGLLLLVLVVPLAVQEGIAAPAPHRPSIELGFTPGTGGWSYLSGTNRSEPPTERQAVLISGPSAYRFDAWLLHPGKLVQPRVRLSTNSRRQYLIPIFHSSYT